MQDFREVVWRGFSIQGLTRKRAVMANQNAMKWVEFLGLGRYCEGIRRKERGFQLELEVEGEGLGRVGGDLRVNFDRKGGWRVQNG